MTDEQTKQAILGFAEFFKGITGNQNLEIPSEIAEKYGIQTQADGEYINKTESLKALDTWDKFGYYNHDMFRLDKDSEKDYVAYIRYDDAVKCINGMPSVAIPLAEPKWIPVSEKLPSDCNEDWVLAQIQEDNGYLWIPCVAEYRKDTDDWYSDANDIGWLKNHRGFFKVIAWMPLPKPYEP